MIKAIDTFYSNHLFRSRLEARWAVYFNELNTEWEYEQEGVQLGDGVKYLPDFYLPKYNIYAEVKPKKFTWQEHRKCKRLCNLSRKIVIELVGLPSTKTFDIITAYSYFECPSCGRKENFLIGDNVSRCNCKEKMIKIKLNLQSPEEYLETYFMDFIV